MQIETVQRPSTLIPVLVRNTRARLPNANRVVTAANATRTTARLLVF
jgi:hypothetical protein